MNICFVGHFTAGGTEKATFIIANCLQSTHNIFVVNTCSKTPSFELGPEIEISTLPDGRVLRRIGKLVGFFKEKEIDIVITVESMTGIITLLATKLVGCKHIIWEHANYYQNQGSKYIQKVRQLELLIADAYVVLTKRDLDIFQQNFKCKAHLQYIYNIADGFQGDSYNKNSKTIISVGHIRKIKNFIAIPEVGKIVFAKHPDWCWKIFGATEGDEYERVRRRVHEYGLEKNILFCGRSNQMNQEYQKAAMYVMTSLQEGLPMVLLEAKSNGLPIVSFDIQTGPAEIIRDGVNGYLVPPYEIETMAERICQLIENEDLRHEFTEQARMDLEKFEKSSIIAKWNELLEIVANSK